MKNRARSIDVQKTITITRGHSNVSFKLEIALLRILLFSWRDREPIDAKTRLMD